MKQYLNSKKMLTVDEVSAYTGLSKSTIYKMTSGNTIPHYKPNGKILYFKKTELDKWLATNKIDRSPSKKDKYTIRKDKFHNDVISDSTACAILNITHDELLLYTNIGIIEKRNINGVYRYTKEDVLKSINDIDEAREIRNKMYNIATK